MGSASDWLREERRRTLGDWAAFCLGCGHVGCCDSSPNRHATHHFKTVGHPLVVSYERGERWAWCYADEVDLDVPAAALAYLR